MPVERTWRTRSTSSPLGSAARAKSPSPISALARPQPHAFDLRIGPPDHSKAHAPRLAWKLFAHEIEEGFEPKRAFVEAIDRDRVAVGEGLELSLETALGRGPQVDVAEARLRHRQMAAQRRGLAGARWADQDEKRLIGELIERAASSVLRLPREDAALQEAVFEVRRLVRWEPVPNDFVWIAGIGLEGSLDLGRRWTLRGRHRGSISQRIVGIGGSAPSIERSRSPRRGVACRATRQQN
jgi:hypothetical protein